MDKDRFCELCSMVFSSPVVARSHYDGKVHAKNLRKQALYPTTQPADTLSQRGPGLAIAGPLQASGIDQGMVEEGGKGPQNTSETVDLSDPNKHCRLCAASFNNPHMAQQHYAGRKHQRNHSRQQLLKDLGEDPAQANSFTFPVCNIKLDSVEMYHAHMQGNKHQIKEKKVVDLCKSQKKVYDSFADELADYIHVQKARGIAPKTSFGATGEEEEGEGEANLGKVDGQNKTTLVLPPSSRPPLPLTSLPLHPAAAFYPPPLWCPPYQPPPTHFGFKGGTYEQTAWGHAFPQGFLPGSAPAGFIGWPKARGRGKECSSSSSSYTSSSSCSSDSSDSSDSDYRHRERKRRKRKMRKERGRRAREEDSEERKRRRGKSLRDDDTEGRRGREHDEEAEEESKRKRKRLHYSSRSHREGHRAKKRREEDEDKEGRKEEKEESTEERVGGGEEKEVHIQAEIQEEMEEREQAKETKAKHRKDKKKTKEKVDTRTEEEKLWDESIIGL